MTVLILNDHLEQCLFGFRLHDRKLCVLGLCTLLSMGQSRPPVLNECINQIMPSMILLFDGLKRAYAGIILMCFVTFQCENILFVMSIS